MSKNFKILSLIGTILLLSGCNATKDALGLDRNSPDEHTVLEREPLTLPPNFYELPEPQPGAARPQETSPQDKAKTLVHGKKPTGKSKAKTQAEAELLEKAGADGNQEDIRKVVDTEARVSESEKSFIKTLVGVEDEKSGKTINPDEEYEKMNGQAHPNAS